MSINILHTADIHLRDSQFGRLDRGRDFSKALFQLVDIAKANKCDYILAAGDILHTKRPSSQNISDLMEMNRRLLDKGVKMLCIAGNHDECDPNWMALLEQEMIKSAGVSAIEDITGKMVSMLNPNATSGSGTLTIYGAPYPDMHPDDFREQAPHWPKADILLYHGGVKEFAFYPMGDKTLSIEDLPYANYQVIALGDIHTCKYMNRNGTLIGYPGPIEYCSANEAPTKSCTILRFEEKTGQLLKFSEQRDIVPIHTRHVIQCEVNTESDMNTLLEEIRACRDKNPIVRVWYDPSINDVFTRVASIIDPAEGIIRVEPRSKGSSSFEGRTDIEYTDLKPSDFVPDFFESNSELSRVATQCCNSENKPGVLIDQYIETQLASYYETKF